MATDPEKVKRAKAHPNRPGKDCKAEPAAFHPEINRSKCEGKRDCVAVCPYDVFEVRTIDDADFAALGFFAKLKSRAHGKQSAYTPRAEHCRACGLCVVACPEHAITLIAPDRADKEQPR
jgi:NAD-dependent dihydropyrimidine dehydrogenase PreA subunit